MVVDPAVLEETDYESDTDTDTDPDLGAIAVSLDLNFEFEDRPLSSRGGPGRPKRAEIPWEKMLDACRQHPGQDMRIRIYDPQKTDKADSKAKALAREIRARLFTHVPLELWDVSHRHFPSDNTFRVYAKFERTLSKKESDERIAKAKAQSQRLAEARAKNKAEQEKQAS